MHKMSLFAILIMLSMGLRAAVAEDTPSYLYYYSRMLGGIIIERADGTDSRLIGADVIPPGMDGLRGLGWSPSGRYFLATSINYSDGGHYNVQGIYLFDDAGQQPIPYLATAGAVYTAQWSPDGGDLLMIVAGDYGRPYDNVTISYLLVAPSTGQVLAEFEATLVLSSRESNSPDLIWDFEAQQVIFYIVTDPDIPERRQPYRVMMSFDGSVLKEPMTEAEFNARPDVPDVPYSIDIGELSTDAIDISPSGRYQASRDVLQDMQIGTEIELPVHSQGTICRKFFWSNSEQYILSLTGTLIAGGGCASAVLGVTDLHGQLWRELGGCSWDVPPCVSWLPPRVDVSSLPPGQQKPIQLDPVAYEPVEHPDYFSYLDETNFEFHCGVQRRQRYIVDKSTQSTVYTLDDIEKCPYSSDRGDEGVPVVIAYDPSFKLLATYTGRASDSYLSIWKECAYGPSVKILKLMSYGTELEFTPDGKQLRARNYNAWKIYDVADILAAANRDC